jgi:hypothetical protein
MCLFFLDETQPTLTGCESINATLGQKVTCPLSFEDGHDIYFIANNANAKINKTSSAVEYTQSNTDPVDIQYVFLRMFDFISTFIIMFLTFLNILNKAQSYLFIIIN